MLYNMFEIPVPEVKKLGRPNKGSIKPIVEPKKLGKPFKFNTLDADGNTMNPRDGTLHRRGKYLKQVAHLKKYHKLDYPNRADYEGQDIEVIFEIISKMKEMINTKKPCK